MEEKVEHLLSQVTHDSSDDIAKKLAEIEDVVPLLLDIFPSLTDVQKIAVVQVGLYRNDKNLKRFIQNVVDSHELFFIKEVAEGVLEIQQRENNENNVQRLLHRLKDQPHERQITDLATIGYLGSRKIVPYLENLSLNNKDVIEQRDIAMLQIKEGIPGLVREYRTRSIGYSTRGLREALYHSFTDSEVVRIVLEDLYEEDTETLIDTTTIMLYEPLFPNEAIDQKIIQRLLLLLEGEYTTQVKENALLLLKRAMKKNRSVKAELDRIYTTKSYMKKRNIIHILKSKELTHLFREVLNK